VFLLPREFFLLVERGRREEKGGKVKKVKKIATSFPWNSWRNGFSAFQAGLGETVFCMVDSQFAVFGDSRPANHFLKADVAAQSGKLVFDPDW
jgi:hypothetical protein